MVLDEEWLEKILEISGDQEGKAAVLKAQKGAMATDSVSGFLFNLPIGRLVAQRILRAVVDPELEVISTTTQHHFRLFPDEDAKEGITDVLVKTKQGRDFLLEFQLNSDPAYFNHKRMVWYGSARIAEKLQSGESWENLQPVCCIMVSEKDLLGYGLPQYSVIGWIRELDRPASDFKELDGQCQYIYLNPGKNPDDPVGRLVMDLFCADPEKVQDPIIREALREIRTKESEKQMYQFYSEEGKAFAAKVQAEIKSLRGSLSSETMRADLETKRADLETKRADLETKRADSETKRADSETRRADNEKRRADAAITRADQLQEELARLKKKYGESND